MNYLEFAIQMELDGAKYYKELAELNKNNSLHSIFILLAKDEEYHAETLKKKAAELPYQLMESRALEEYVNVFQTPDEGDEAVVHQLEGYRLALEKERESIKLYEKMLAEAEDINSKEFFNYLIEQEKSHYKIFDGLIDHLRKAKEWVESAEFNKNETY